MRELEIHREIHRREARRAGGLNPYSPQLLTSQVATAPFEGSLLTLPVNVDNRSPMQLADGTFYFTFDFDELGGPNPWA